MIVMCFKKHLIFGDDPLFPDGRDFGDVSRQNIIMIDKKKVTFRGKVCGNGRFYEVSVEHYDLYLRLVSFRLLHLR